jgi:hypothetical protein
LIIGVSTIKDTRANVEKFVRRNVQCGIDHLVVLLDAPLPEVEELLEAHPDVSVVRAHGDWWQGHAPTSLNDRQICNAGLVSRLVGGYPWAEWVFALDGDEVACIDRGVLDRLPPEVRGARLTPLEAVSSLSPEHDPTLFKRLLTDDELELLAALGTITEARNRAYFRGHVAGKPGVRPSRDLALGVHQAVDTTTGELLDLAEVPGLTLLHYESYDQREFVRKWRALLGSGIDVNHRQDRRRLARSVRALLNLGLEEDQRAVWLERLFERCALDDVDTLSGLGLLVEVDPDAVVRDRQPVPPEPLRQLQTLLDRAHDVPKQRFRPKSANPQRTAKSIAKLQRGV